jgi:hypothetical protein
MTETAKAATKPPAGASTLPTQHRTSSPRARVERRGAAKGSDAGEMGWVVPFLLTLAVSLMFFVTQVVAYA